jgi:hypothetical protein
MERGNGRLELVGARALVDSGSLQQQPPFVNESPIPTTPILFVEQHNLSIRVEACRYARVLQQHQGQKSEHLWFGWEETQQQPP